MELLDMATYLILKGYNMDVVNEAFENDEEWIINQYHVEKWNGNQFCNEVTK